MDCPSNVETGIGYSKNLPLASIIWKRDFDFNSIVDNSLLFPKALSALKKLDLKESMLQLM